MSVAEQFTPAVAHATRVGQGTEVEKARAATQVQGAIYIAQQFPRDEERSRARMLRACGQMELAGAAFYSFPRGGQMVAGMTVAVACELAQCWGNVDYGLTELRRDDAYGQSEMYAFAWDLETNVRIGSTFIVEHTRDTKKGSYRLTDSRDIYEKNTNEGNRRMRAAILKMLPSWYVAHAESALRSTLRHADSGKPLAARVEETSGHFANRYGLTTAQLEEHVGRPVERWDDDDLVKLRITWQSLSRGELRVEDAFPAAKVTAEEITGRDGADGVAGEHNHAESYDPDCGECRRDAVEADRELADGENDG